MIEINNKTRKKVPLLKIKKIVNQFFTKFKIRRRSVSIALVGDQIMTKLNRVYRQERGPTDVLVFAGEGDFLGEIIIDLAQIQRQAKIYSKNFYRELIFVLVHGLLHLVGYSDQTKTAQIKMMKAGEKFINSLKT